MSIGYTIQMGYGEGDWQDLKEAALEICDNVLRIYNEAVKFDAPVQLEGETLLTYTAAFYQRTDLTIEFVEPGHRMWSDDYPRPFIHMMASGGGPARILKEHTRRAFLRLIMGDMHRQGMDISITVS